MTLTTPFKIIPCSENCRTYNGIANARYFLNLENAVLRGIDEVLEYRVKQEIQSSATTGKEMPSRTFDAVISLKNIKINSFPWPAKTLPMSTAYSAALFRLLMIFVFVIPFRYFIVSIMKEKEEGQKNMLMLMGVRPRTYVLSWIATQVLLSSGTILIIAIAGIFPFKYSPIPVMLLIYFAVILSLISFSFFLTSLFRKTNVCLLSGLICYFASSLPGYCMISLQVYGGSGRHFSCLFPTSAIAILAEMMLR